MKRQIRDQKVWFVTGISNGLGKSLADAIIKSGDLLIGTFRHQDQVRAFNDKHKGMAVSIKLDITHIEEIDLQIESLIKKYGRIDVLVNNAGVGFTGAIEESSMDEVRHVMEANFFGSLKMTQAVLPYMRKQSKGSIVQISSHGGIKSFPGFGIYNASKFALEGFSEALADELRPLGVDVIIVEPGPFRTNFAGRGLLEAKRRIEDYSGTAGAFREKLKTVHGLQEGDPAKAALAILERVNSDSKDSLRLPLGKIPLHTIQLKLDSVKSDLERNRTRAEFCVF